MTEWRTAGSHYVTRWDADGTPYLMVCMCGPANALTGPQWVDASAARGVFA